MRKFIAHIIKYNTFVQFLYSNIMSSFFSFVGAFVSIDKNLVLINSMGGEQYSDSSKALYEEMLKDKRFDKFHFVWAFDKPSKFDEKCYPALHNKRTKIVEIDKPNYFYTALKAKIWISNVNIERGLHFKKNETIYLNTWHGTGPKFSGNLSKGRRDYDFSYVDILCVDGSYQQEAMIKMFNGKKDNLLHCGRPREDELLAYKDKDKDVFRKKLSIPYDKKVILYMPTWRENVNPEPDWCKWEKALSSDYVLLVRAHHFSKENIFKKHNNAFWIDVTEYPIVNELYYVADILISDYSSAIFDFGLLGRPIISFAKDYDQYMKDIGLYMADWEQRFPNGVLKTDEDVIRFIKTMNYVEESKKSKNFVDSIVSHPCNATKACLDKLHELLLKK